MLEEVVITAPRNTSSPSTEQPVNVNSQSPAVLKTTTVDTTTVQDNTQGEAPTTKTTVTQTTAGALGRWKKVGDEVESVGRFGDQIMVTITYEDSETGKKVNGSAVGDEYQVNRLRTRADMAALNRAAQASSN